MKTGIALHTTSVANKNCGLSLKFYEHFIAYAGLQKKRRALILFLRSHACRAKVFIMVKCVHHGRWPMQPDIEVAKPAPQPNASATRSDKLCLYNLGLEQIHSVLISGSVASCHWGSRKEVFYFLCFKKL